MEHYAGLDVSLELTSVCIVDARGEIMREAKVGSDPEARIRFLGDEDLEIARVGLEVGPLSQWLYAGLIAAGYEAVLLETAREGCAVGDDGENRSARRPGYCPAPAPWLASRGAREVRELVGAPRAAHRA